MRASHIIVVPTLITLYLVVDARETGHRLFDHHYDSMPPQSVTQSTEPDLSSNAPDPNPDLDRKKEKVICSCKLRPRSDDDPDGILRPIKVALHHATDHWRPKKDRFVRSTVPKSARLKLNPPQQDRERSSSPTKRKRADRASPSPSSDERHSKRDASPHKTHKSHSDESHHSGGVTSTTDSGSTTLSEVVSETNDEIPGLGSSSGESNMAQQADESQLVSSSSIQKPEPDRQQDTEGDGSPKSSQSRVSKRSSFPPNLRGGRLLPNRLLQSEQQVSATHPHNHKVVFEGFSSKPKRVYGKVGARRS